MPNAAKPAKFPNEIESVEQLFLRGLHLEQYRHATYNPIDYYLEGLKREPGDVRCNNAMGLLLLRKGQFEQAESYFRTAIETLTERNPNPYDGEPYYNLGQCLKYQGRFDEAYKAFYKSAWNATWQDAAYFHLAQIACLQNDLELALELVEKSLLRNWHNHKARVLKISLLRLTGQEEKASKLIKDSLEIDKFNFGALYEKYLLASDKASLIQLKILMRGNIHNYIEYALDYAAAGLFDEAVSLINVEEDIKNTDPMALYYNAWFESQRGNNEIVLNLIQKAETTNVDGCFAYRLEAVEVLESVISIQPNAAKANYHLGNFWYDRRQYSEAISHWEKSRELDNQFATVHRNLALAYFNKKDDKIQALSELELAFALDTTDARILMELDQLYKRLNHPLEKRLEILEKYPELVDFRDDLYLERCTLYNQLGQYSKCLDLLISRQFHPWEGGEGKVTGQYLHSLTMMARAAISENNFDKAIELLERTAIYPDNFGEGKLDGTQENDIHYWLGCAYKGLGNQEKATFFWEKSSIGLSEPSAAVFYNDQQPDKIFYQGLSLLKLGRQKEATIRFDNLKNYGEKHMQDEVTMDYFAVSLPDLLIWEDDLNIKNQAHCQYLIGLGALGKNEIFEAKKKFEQILKMDVNHQGAQIHLKMTR